MVGTKHPRWPTLSQEEGQQPVAVLHGSGPSSGRELHPAHPRALPCGSRLSNGEIGLASAAGRVAVAERVVTHAPN